MVLPPLDHIGIVVADVDRAVDYYSSVFGLGPFKVNEGAAMKEVNFKGRKEDCKLKSAVAKSGAVEIEIIQVLEGECPHRDFLREGRQGLHHLAFRGREPGLDARTAWPRGGSSPCGARISASSASPTWSRTRSGG